MSGPPRHPAPFLDDVLGIAVEELKPCANPRMPLMIVDPFAGSGKIHELRTRYDLDAVTIGVELLPKWAAIEGNMLGDATHLPDVWTGLVDAVVTSPCYGNRMADHHEAADYCKACGGGAEAMTCSKCKGTGLSHRRSYRHYYGDGFFDVDQSVNAAAMQWGPEYKALHAAAWREVERILRPGGLFLLNVKDHVRDGHRVRVSAWHRRTVLSLGFVELGRWDIPTTGYGFGANSGARVPCEYVYVFERTEVLTDGS